MSAAPSVAKTSSTTFRPTSARSQTATPTANPAFTGFLTSISVRQTITGLDPTAWANFGLSTAYQMVLARALGVSVGDVSVTSFSARRHLQSTKTVTVYSTVNARGAADAYQVQSNVGSSGVQASIQIALNAVPGVCSGKNVNCLTVSPCSLVSEQPTAPPASGPGSASAQSNAGASGTNAGLPTATLGGIIAGALLFVVAIVFLVYRMQAQGGKDAARGGSFNKGELYSAYGPSHSDNFGSVSPGFRRESRGGSESGRGPRSGAGHQVELTDYRGSGYSGGDFNDNNSYRSNPGFGTVRKSFDAGNRRSLTSPAALEDRHLPQSGRIEPPAGAPRSVMPRANSLSGQRLSFSRGGGVPPPVASPASGGYNL